MMVEENSPLIGEALPARETNTNKSAKGLSVFFTILCIVDLFGVFPVVTLPKVVISCGVYGIPVVLFVFTLQIYTAILLGRCWLIATQIEPNIIHKNRYPYAALAEMTYGPAMSRFVTILLDATVFGGGIPNLLVASQNLQLFGLKMSDYKMNFSFCWWLIIIGIILCPIMWLGSPKDMKLLAVVSVVVVTSVMVTTCVCIVNDTKSSYNGATIVPKLQDILMAYGVLAFQFDIHPMLLTIQVDMKDSSKIAIAVVGGFLVTATMFSVTTCLAASRYGSNVESNILQGLPASFPLYFVVLCVTVQLCLSSAVGNSALFQHAEDTLGISREFGVKRCLLRALVVALAVFLGETVPRFDLVMGLVGSTLTGPLMFILPPLLYGKIILLRKKFIENAASRIVTHTTYSAILPTSSQESPATFVESQTIDLAPQSRSCDESKESIDVESNYKIIDSRSLKNNIVKMTYQMFDITAAVLVMCFGILATSIAAFYSWSDAIAYAQFTPPCLINLTAATSSLHF